MGHPAQIRASRLVPAPPAALFEFLADLENHWWLAGRFIEIVSLERDPDGAATGGRVRMRGPLGLHRTAATRVLVVESTRRMVGLAEVGGRTRADVEWTLDPAADGRTRVRLEAAVDRAGPVDRALLALGGRAWLKRRFAAVLERLEEAPAILPDRCLRLPVEGMRTIPCVPLGWRP